MAKYKEIAKEIKKRINNKEYEIDTPLPNQESLAKEFQTSRVTIQKALQLLVVEGVVFSRQGSGTYVRKNTLQRPTIDIVTDEYIGLTQRVSEKGKITNTTITFTVRFPNEEECEKLLIDKTTPIYDIIRLRSLNNEPYLMEYTKMPVHVVPNVNEEVLKGSIYSYLKNELKLKIGGANRRIQADRPKKLEIMHLECHEHDPMLDIEQVAYLSNGTPFEYSRSRHRYDKRGVLILSLYNEN